MRLATFEHDGRFRVGAIRDGLAVPFAGVETMQQLIERSAAEQLPRTPDLDEPIDIDSVRLCAPLPDPIRNVICVGWNYRAHFEEGRSARPEQELPDSPTFFSKATTTVIGPFDPIPSHAALTQKLDWEVELAIVIGKRGRDISDDESLSHVFGYTVANDISARDLQQAHGKQWFKGKSLDGSLPMGPMLVTPDELDGPEDLQLTCRLNGEVVQSASTAQMIFPIARIIAELSAGMTLVPGDVILTGTPEGIGNRRTPPVYLRDGDVLESEISGIGLLRNTIRDLRPDGVRS